MTRRLSLALALALVIFLQSAASPAGAQTPPTQASPNTVRAAIPAQAPQPAVPPAASVPSLARPATAPTPALAALPAPAVAPVPAAAPQAATAPVPPQARPPVAQTPPTPRPEAAPPNLKPFADYEAANVKVEVTITYQVGNGTPVKRMATLTVADQGRGSLRSGTQVAVPSTTIPPAVPGGSAPIPITSYNYKSVGLNVDANRVVVQGTRARMDLNVEFSAVDDKPGATGVGGNYPLFPTFSQNLTLVLESGKEVVVGQSSDVVDNQERKQTVTVKATILR